MLSGTGLPFRACHLPLAMKGDTLGVGDVAPGRAESLQACNSSVVMCGDTWAAACSGLGLLQVHRILEGCPEKGNAKGRPYRGSGVSPSLWAETFQRGAL